MTPAAIAHAAAHVGWADQAARGHSQAAADFVHVGVGRLVANLHEGVGEHDLHADDAEEPQGQSCGARFMALRRGSGLLRNRASQRASGFP